jgi:hypothetical protein
MMCTPSTSSPQYGEREEGALSQSAFDGMVSMGSDGFANFSPDRELQKRMSEELNLRTKLYKQVQQGPVN